MQDFQYEDYTHDCQTHHVGINSIESLKANLPFSIDLQKNPNGLITITINVWDGIAYNFKVKNKSGRVSKKTKPIPYKHMTIGQQQAFLKIITDKCVTPYFEQGIGVYGVCKSGNLHVHYLVHSDTMSSDFELTQFKKQLNQILIVTRLSKNQNLIKHMYYIAYNQYPLEQALEYLFKNHKEHDMKLPIYTFNRNNGLKK